MLRAVLRATPGSRIWQCGQYSGPVSKLFRHRGQVIVVTSGEYSKHHFTEYLMNAAATAAVRDARTASCCWSGQTWRIKARASASLPQ